MLLPETDIVNQYPNERYTLNIVQHNELQNLILNDCNVCIASLAARSKA